MTTYTFDQVLTILRNMGIDVTCGGCMQQAMTGFGGYSVENWVGPGSQGHTCKNDPSVHDDAEPLFTLRGQDWIAPEIVREWAFRSLKQGSPMEKVDGARRIADAMENWQIANKRKVAD